MVICHHLRLNLEPLLLCRVGCQPAELTIVGGNMKIIFVWLYFYRPHVHNYLFSSRCHGYQFLIWSFGGCQYRFLVDGTWRFDERQPCLTDEYGTVNNVVFVEEPSIAHAARHHEVFVPRNSEVVDGISVYTVCVLPILLSTSALVFASCQMTSVY